MAQENYTNIPVTKDIKAKLNKRKIKREHELGKSVTWDDFLLEATKKYA